VQTSSILRSFFSLFLKINGRHKKRIFKSFFINENISDFIFIFEHNFVVFH